MTAMRKRRLRVAAFIGLLASALSLAGPLRAADAPSRDSSTVKSIAGSVVPPASATPALKPARPYWIELTIAQRQALAPLTDDWERLDGQTKKKWVEIANRYPKMKSDEQQHTQERMREWAMLTPEQRRVARDSFARVRAMPPEQRAEMLRKYRELPDEKKHELATQSQAKMLVVPKPQATPSARRVQLSEGAKVKNPAIAAQRAAGSRLPELDPVKAPETVKPPQSAAAPTMPIVAQPAAQPAALPAPPAATSADAPAK